jgi:Ca2+:H+ antiporter
MTERPLIFVVLTAALFLWFGGVWLDDLSATVRSAALFVWLFGVIVWGSIAVVRHADHLAALVGEPFGTLVLTLSVATIEIMTIAVVMLTGDDNPALARDTMFSVVMIVLNGLVGIMLLLGGWRYREQEYNLRGVNAYLCVIIALAVFGMMMPNFTQSTVGPTFSSRQETFLIVMSLALYTVFLAIQTTRHRGFFVLEEQIEERDRYHHVAPLPPRSPLYHSALLATYLALVVFLAEKLAIILNHGLDVLREPPALGALVVAILVLAPEGLGAVEAALANRLQRAVNILLGSVLATLALTIPSVLVVGLLRGKVVVLGLDGVEQVMLGLTLLVSMVTFASGRTNILQGAVHLMLFLGYLMLIWD